MNFELFLQLEQLIQRQSLYSEMASTVQKNWIQHARSLYDAIDIEWTSGSTPNKEMELLICSAMGLFNCHYNTPIFFKEIDRLLLTETPSVTIETVTKNQLTLHLPETLSTRSSTAVIDLVQCIVLQIDIAPVLPKFETNITGAIQYINALWLKQNRVSKTELRGKWAVALVSYFNKRDSLSIPLTIRQAIQYVLENKLFTTSLHEPFRGEKSLYQFGTKRYDFLLFLLFWISISFFMAIEGAYFLALSVGIMPLILLRDVVKHYFSFHFYLDGFVWKTYYIRRFYYPYNTIDFTLVKDIEQKKYDLTSIVLYKNTAKGLETETFTCDLTDEMKGAFVYYYSKAHKDKLFTSFSSIKTYTPKHNTRIPIHRISDILEEKFKYFKTLPSVELKNHFIHRVNLFIRYTDFTPKQGMELTDEHLVLIAAVAQQLAFGLNKGYLYNYFQDIFIYPRRYTSASTGKQHLGEMNTRGIIKLSWEDFEKGINIADDSYNVGLHEFAHALEYMDFIYEEMDNHFADALEKVLHLSTPYIHKKKVSTLFRSYAITNQHEFLAVSTEYFFEKPEALKKEEPTIYVALQKLYRQDPITFSIG
ncbi:MAG: zinc-dependent peptidase [Cytophagaceae bacterium]|jgi:hypothetical protein|nr:zinc-dependent peptidase [Cytophagaceae bacterium]